MRKSIVRRSLSILAAAGLTAFALTACAAGSNSGGPADSDAPSASTSGQFKQELFDMLPKSIQDSKTINVANPFSTSWVRLKDDGKTLTGPVPDMSAALEPILGVKFNWIESPFPNLIPGLQSGKFDMVWGSVSETEERYKVMNMVPYAQGLNALIVLKGNPKNITDVDDSLCGLRAGTQSGSLQLELLKKQAQKCQDEGKPALQVSAYDSVPASLLAVRSEKIDAFLGTYAAIIQITQEPDQKGIFEQVGELQKDTRSALGVALDSGDFAKAMQGAIKELIDDGEYLDILKKYGYQDMAITPDEVTINGK